MIIINYILWVKTSNAYLDGKWKWNVVIDPGDCSDTMLHLLIWYIYICEESTIKFMGIRVYYYYKITWLPNNVKDLDWLCGTKLEWITNKVGRGMNRNPHYIDIQYWDSKLTMVSPHGRRSLSLWSGETAVGYRQTGWSSSRLQENYWSFVRNL